MSIWKLVSRRVSKKILPVAAIFATLSFFLLLSVSESNLIGIDPVYGAISKGFNFDLFASSDTTEESSKETATTTNESDSNSEVYEQLILFATRSSDDECKEAIVDNSDDNCFDVYDPSVWEEQGVGYKGDSIYTDVNWLPSLAKWEYDDVHESIEIFATIPSLSVGANLSSEVTYLIVEDGEEIGRVVIDQAASEGTAVSLGVYEFDGDARVLLSELNSNEDTYIIADAVSFGVPFGNPDLIPPKIENVVAFPDEGILITQAKVTDEGSGVKSSVLYFNNGTYVMQPSLADIYAAAATYSANATLEYYIVATDNAGNSSIWNPTRGYISRGAFYANLGFPNWQNYKGKCNYLSNAKQPCSAKSSLSGITGDPINTQNGNLIDQQKLVLIPGRPTMDLHLTYNSQGGRASIFGENWTHSYNYSLIEMNNVYFQGAFVQYPDGHAVKFTGPTFEPSPGNFEKLQKLRDGTFILYFKDLTQIHFDSFGDITRWQDANGNGLNFEYGEKTQYTLLSQLTKITSDGGRSLQLEYNSEGFVQKIIAPEDKILEFKYNPDSDLIEFIDGRKNSTKFEYVDHRMTKKISPKGHSYFENKYDDQGRISYQKTGLSFENSYTYESVDGGTKTTINDAYGNITIYEYNKEGLLTRLTDANGKFVLYEYSDKKQVVKMTDKDGHIFVYSYDSNGNKIYEKDPLGHEIVREFDSTFNKPTFEKYKEDDHITRWEYDVAGNLIRVENAKQDNVTYVYNQFGQLTEYSDFNNNVTKYSYTPEGDISTVTSPLNEVRYMYYDGLGRLTREVNARGFEKTFAYDRNDNLITISGPLGYTESFTYDQNNNLTSHVDANGGVVVYKYDASENLIETRNQLAFVTTYTYGLMNEMLETKDPEGRVTKYKYDKIFHLTEKTEAFGTEDQITTLYEYDGMGDLTRMTDPEGRITELQYDQLRRVIKEIQNVTATPPDHENNVTTEYFYSPSGALEKVIDPNGQQTVYTLNELDQIVKKTDAEGNETDFEYDAQGNIKKLTNPREYLTTYEYDPLNRISKIINPLQGVTEYKYDPNGNIEQIVDANNIVSKYEYNELDRKSAQTRNYQPSSDPNSDTNVKTEYQYDLHGNLTKLTNPRGFSTQFKYDSAHRNSEIIDANGNSTLYSYDKVNNLLKVTDRSGNEVEYQYDNLNRVAKEINQEDHAESYDYDKVGNLIQLINRRNKTFGYQYDPLNRLRVITDPYQKTEIYTYDAVGNKLSFIDENGHTSTYGYDKINRLETATDAEGFITGYEYDANSNLIRVIDAELNPTDYAYDELDRLVSKTNAELEAEQYDYDNLNNRTLLTEADGTKHKYEYDGLYRLINVINNFQDGVNPTHEINVQTQYEYDANGNHTKTTDPLNRSTSFEYDNLDRLAKEINAINKTWSYEYDKEGNLTKRIDAKNITTLYSYYPDYELKTINYPDHTVTYSYNQTNFPTQMVDKLGTTTWEYDDLDRLINQNDALSRTLSYDYDPVGNLRKLTYPDQKFVQHTYMDNNWLLSSTTHDGDSATYTRNKVGYTTYIDRSNSSYSDITYDKVYRPLLVDDHQLDNGDHLIHTFEYTYNDVGHITEEVARYGWRNPEQVVTTFEYDGLHRITAAIDDDESESHYSYDAVGNRLVQTEEIQQGTETRTFSYNDINQVTQIDVNSPHPPDDVTHIYNYDSNGNRVQRTIEKQGVDWVTDYSYDTENRLTQVHNHNENVQPDLLLEPLPQPNRTDLEYDGNGRRLVKTFTPGNGDQSDGANPPLAGATEGGDGKRTEYLFSGLDPVAEFDIWDGQYRNYYRDGDNDLMFFQKFGNEGKEYVNYDLLTGEELSRDPDGTIYFYHYDGEGNIGATSKHTAQSDHAYRYDEYGGIMPESGNWTEPHNQYTLSQKEVDSYMGLYYFGSRHYDPYTGSWISQDSYRGDLNNPMSLHRYMYNYNSPINYIDLYGYAPWGDIDFTPEWMDDGTAYLGDQINKLDAHRYAYQRILEDKYGPVVNGVFGGVIPMSMADRLVYGDPGELVPGACTTYELQYSYYYNFAYNQGVADDAYGLAFSMFDPIDYVSTGYRWANNDFSYWDLAMIVPILPGGTVRFVNKVDEGGVLASKFDNLINKGDEVTEIGYKSFTAGNFRDNLKLLTGSAPEGAQAHHVFPQQKDLAAKFESVGININDPKYGAWWDATPGIEGNHQSIASTYNDDWSNFFKKFEEAEATPTSEDILEFGRELGDKYGFEINY